LKHQQNQARFNGTDFNGTDMVAELQFLPPPMIVRFSKPRSSWRRRAYLMGEPVVFVVRPVGDSSSQNLICVKAAEHHFYLLEEIGSDYSRKEKQT
jgi:hypothetical protein